MLTSKTRSAQLLRVFFDELPKNRLFKTLFEIPLCTAKDQPMGEPVELLSDNLPFGNEVDNLRVLVFFLHSCYISDKVEPEKTCATTNDEDDVGRAVNDV